MPKPYRIQVFGKAGCQKCDALKRRLDKMLTDASWEAFEKEYCDVESADGLVSFAKAQCINPSRIPAMLVLKWDEDTERYRPIENAAPGESEALYGKSKLYHLLGLQTDYSDVGRGVLPPKMLAGVLNEAKVS